MHQRCVRAPVKPRAKLILARKKELDPAESKLVKSHADFVIKGKRAEVRTQIRAPRMQTRHM